MMSIIKCETYKLYKTKRIYIALLIILISMIPSIISEYLVRNVNLATSNGAILSISFLSSSSLFLIPITIIISITTLISNEYADGTLNLLLLKPFKRRSIILGKFFSVSFVILLMLLALFILGYALGFTLFGFNSSLVIKGITLTPKEGLILTTISYVFCIIPFMAFTSLIILICTIFTSPSTSGIISVIILVSNFVLSVFMPEISPLLITEYFNIYSNILENGFPSVIIGLFINTIYIIAFLSLSVFIFNKKDLHI